MINKITVNKTKKNKQTIQDPNKDTHANEIIKLDANINKVKYIIHMADIHIKNDQTNKEEYLHVFNNLYEKIKKLDNLEETIIVICGDIFDNKTTLKADAISMLSEFFSNLCNITDCIIILGNHDQNINNENSTDAITAILNNNFKTKYKNFILKKSGVYEYANITFGVTDIFSNDTTKLNMDTDNIKINLYHGYIHGATLDNEEFNDMVGKFNQKDFSNGDLTLLGDIHKFQYLNKNKTMAYPSSLLQLNYSENLYEHGFIHWNINNKNNISSKFIKIDNKFGYVTIKMENNKVVYEPNEQDILPYNIRLRIIYKDTNSSKRNEIIDKYKNKYNVIQIDEVHKMNGLNFDFSDNDKINKIKNIDNFTTVNNLIIDTLKEKNTYDDTTLQKTFTELNNITKTINYNFNKNTKDIKLIKMVFNNMFIFGEGNTVNFNNLNKIVGLLSDNKTGKTSLIDIIFFSIWGESDRTLFNTDIIKNGTKKMNSTIILSVNGVIYKIERISNVTMKRLVNHLELYQFKDGNYVKINDDDKKKTEDKIRSLFGSLEDFTLLNCLTQDRPVNFLTMVDSERKTLLNKLFDLNIIKIINKEVNAQNRIITSDINYEEDKIKNLNIDDIKNDIIKLTEKKNNLIKKNIEYDEQIIDINKNIGKVEYEINSHDIKNCSHLSIDKLENTLKNKSHDISIIDKQIKDIEQKLNIETNNLKQLDTQTHNYKKITKNNNKWLNDKNSKLDNLNKEYQKLTEEKRPINVISTSDLNKFNDNKNKINTYQNDIENLNGKIKQIDKEFDYNKYNDYLNKINNLTETNQILINHINKDNERLDKLKHHKFNINCNECMTNEITKQKLFLTDDIKNNQSVYDKNTKLINKKNKYIKKFNNDFKIYNNNLKLYNDIENIKHELSIVQSFNNNIENIISVNNNNKKHNDILDDKITDNRRQYKIISDTKNVDYDNYINNQINISSINKTITKLKNDYDTLMDNKNKLNIVINKLNDDIVLYKQNETSIIKIKNLNKTLQILNDNYSTIIADKNNNNIIINKLNDDVLTANINIKNIKASTDRLKLIKDRKNIIEIIKNVTDNGGIIEDILRTSILPAIESVVNNILTDIETFKIKIRYDTNNIKISKIENKNMSESSCLTASGHEKAILNVIFRIALTKLNNKIKTNFFIIDEAFKNSDETRKNKLNTLFEYIRNNYSWCLVITHDDFIKDKFDNEINIEHKGGTSFINFA